MRRPQVSLANLDPYERQSYRDHRWWALADLRSTSEVVLPDGLADLLAPVLDGRIPDAPVTIR